MGDHITHQFPRLDESCLDYHTITAYPRLDNANSANAYPSWTTSFEDGFKCRAGSSGDVRGMARRSQFLQSLGVYETNQTAPAFRASREVSPNRVGSEAQSSGTDGASIAAATGHVSRHINSSGRPFLPVPSSPTRIRALLSRARQHIDDTALCTGRRPYIMDIILDLKAIAAANHHPIIAAGYGSEGTNTHYHECVCPDKHSLAEHLQPIRNGAGARTIWVHKQVITRYPESYERSTASWPSGLDVNGDRSASSEPCLLLGDLMGEFGDSV